MVNGNLVQEWPAVGFDQWPYLTTVNLSWEWHPDLHFGCQFDWIGETNLCFWLKHYQQYDHWRSLKNTPNEDGTMDTEQTILSPVSILKFSVSIFHKKKGSWSWSRKSRFGSQAPTSGSMMSNPFRRRFNIQNENENCRFFLGCRTMRRTWFHGMFCELKTVQLPGKIVARHRNHSKKSSD